MTSQLAKEDIQDLRDAGLNPSDEDIIRLHALALRLSDGPETSHVNAPRWAMAGDTVFHEPTVAAFQWFEYAKAFAGSAADENWFFAFALANGRRAGYLPNLIDPKDIRHAVKAWIKGLHATKREVETAVYYATTGNDDVVPELTEMAKRSEKMKSVTERETAAYGRIEQRIREAAAATGLSFDDLMAQTPDRLLGMIHAANVQAGMEMSRNVAKAHADYIATLAAIKNRLMSESQTQETA